MINPLHSPVTVNATRKAFTLLGEFQNFAIKGNVIDLAVGVIIGAAFGKIVDSLVKNIIMPLVGLIVPGKQSYLEWKLSFNGQHIPYGLFLGEVVNFVIVSAALFLFAVKFLGWISRLRKAEAESQLQVPPPPTKDQALLMEIRDLLKERGQGTPVS